MSFLLFPRNKVDTERPRISNMVSGPHFFLVSQGTKEPTVPSPKTEGGDTRGLERWARAGLCGQLPLPV